MSVYCLIPARGGSKRIKNKNLLKLNGQPLINHTIKHALNSKKINVVTVIPGYIKTKPFNIKASPFLISSPKKAAEIINKSIYLRKEIVYINYLWKIIMIFINLIPEKIFKKLNF